jgi:hypothetical protein
VLAASIIRAMSIIITLMMEAASIFETSVNFYQTKPFFSPEHSHLQFKRYFFQNKKAVQHNPF